MKLKHLFTIISRHRLLNNTLKSSTRYLSSHSPTINPNAPTHFTRPTNYATPVSTFTRYFHSAEPTIPVETETDPQVEDEEEEDVAMTEFLSRFVWIMRGKLADAYPGVDKETVNGMLLIIVARVVDELERGGVGEMILEGSAKSSYDFSEDLWKTVWEVSNNVLEDMNKARKKEEMKKYIQSEEVKEMCRFASEVGVRGNMLREFRFKWAKEKMEEAELYQSLHQMREQAEYDDDDEEQELGTKVEERKEGEEGEADQVTISEKLDEEVVKNGSDVDTEIKPKVVSIPQRRGKIKYNIYGLDLSDPKWAQVADKIHESEKLITPEEPKPITGKAKLATEKILQLTEGDDPSPLFAEWKKLLKPSRVDWLTLFDRLRENNAGIYLKVAELILDEDSFQANIRDYAKLIDAHAKADRMDAAERILQKMAEKNIQPDILISTTLVHMYSKAGFFDRAKEAFGQLRSQGFQLGTRVYSSMVMACINAGELKMAEALMQEMDAPGKEIFMALLGSYSERGLIDGSFRVSTLMHFAGFKPTLESCTLLVEAYARAGDDAMAKKEFDHMRNLGLKPGDRCAASLISLYEKKNHLDKALDLLLELESDGFESGIATYTALVDWFGKLQLIQEAEEAFRRITEKGWTPPIKVHVSLCDMYSRAHDEKKALQTLGIVEGKMDLLGKDEFERMISGLLAGGLQEDARRIHGMMETRGFSASEQIELSFMASNAFRVQRPGARIT